MSEIQSIDSSTYAYKALTALASISQAAENDERFISCGTKYLYSLGNWRTSRVSSVMYQLRKAGFLRSAVHVHSDGRSRRPCADQYITSLGMAFLKRNNIPFGTVTRPDVPVINHPSSTTSMTENQKLDEVPTGQDLNRNPVSAPLVLTETERVSAELLASRAQNVGSNGKSEKRVSNPAEILLAEGIVENLPMALSIISVLKQHGILSLVAETENDDNPRYIYVVKDAIIPSAKVVSLSEIEKTLRKRFRASESKSGKLRNKLHALQAERDRLDAEIKEFSVQLREEAEARNALQGKLAKFQNLLREFSQEFST